MRSRYDRDIYLFLSLYRFFAYGLAVVLIQVVAPAGVAAVGFQTYLLLITIGIYTLVKVLGPLRWWQTDPMTYVFLGSDLLVSLLALLLTGGLTSGFLLYSFLPMITAALLFEERLALLTAGISSLTTTLAHLVLSRWADSFAWVMEGNILLWLIFYVVASFLVAISVYRTNLNIRTRIQQDAIMEERRRMRREIHDGVAQTLSYLSMKTDTVCKLVSDGQLPRAISGMEDMRGAVDETYKTVRESLDQLSIEVGTVPLTVAIEEYLKQFQERNSIRTQLEIPDTILNLSPVAELQVLRIAQEALANVRKHAEATDVCVTLRSIPSGVQLSIKDNGRGFESPSQFDGNGPGHHGLTVMRERAEGLGGTLALVATPGEGTEVRV
ncbi:sensor histidine kinase, partial [Chloroflexota bacterium]